MRINTNVAALSAFRNLNTVQDAVSDSMAKLSSGFRINKAADDAAGLGIANKLQADTRGYTQVQTSVALSQAVFADGALSARIKNIVAVAVAHVTQCPYCIRGHTRAALREGASHQELMEAIWVAAEMRAGAAFAHSLIAIAEMGEAGLDAPGGRPPGAPATGEHHGH